MMFSSTVNHLMHDEGKTTTDLLTVLDHTDSLENVPRIMSDINLVPTERWLKLVFLKNWAFLYSMWVEPETVIKSSKHSN